MTKEEIWNLAEKMLKDNGYISIWSVPREQRESYLERAEKILKETENK
jgi:hypothetical protein